MFLWVLLFILKGFPIGTVKRETGASVGIDPGEFFLGGCLEDEVGIGVYKCLERSITLSTYTVLTGPSVNFEISPFARPPLHGCVGPNTQPGIRSGYINPRGTRG